MDVLHESLPLWSMRNLAIQPLLPITHSISESPHHACTRTLTLMAISRLVRLAAAEIVSLAVSETMAMASVSSFTASSSRSTSVSACDASSANSLAASLRAAASERT